MECIQVQKAHFVYKILVLFFFSLSWSFHAGCGQQKKAAFGERCLFSTDCEKALHCIQGICSTTKKAGDDCLTDSECSGSLRCYGKTCTFGERRECKERAQCGANRNCFLSKTEGKKFCADNTGEGLPCRNDEDCKAADPASSLKCSGHFCLPPSDKGSPCPDTQSCLAPLVCSSNGLCIQSGQPGTGDVNADCQNEKDCQKGLICDSNTKKCAAGGSENQPCKLTLECQKGLVCNARQKCAKKGTEGTAGSGELCGKKEDCQSGLVCGSESSCVPPGAVPKGRPCTGSEQCLEGLVCARIKGKTSGECRTAGGAGTATVGKPCEKQEDCAFPLACAFGGVCTPIRAYAGVTCQPTKEIKGDFRVLFEVPKGKKITEFYRLPFPNDIRFVGGHISLSGHPNPGALLGNDIIGKYFKAIESEVKGFGTNPTVLLRFSRAIEFNSFALNSKKPGLLYVNLTRNLPVGSSIRYRYNKGKYICQHSLSVRPANDKPLEPNTTYAVIITNVLKDKDGTTIRRDADFDTIMAEATPNEPTLRHAHTVYKKLRDYLKKNAQSGKWPGPSDVVGAAVFTTQNPTNTMEPFRQVIKDRGAPKLTELTKCDGQTPSPCEGKGLFSRSCGKPNPDYVEYHAKIELPIFQQGKAPYKDEGGDITYDEDGKPKIVRTEKVCVAFTIPKKGTMPKNGWPIALYAHGTGGNFRIHIINQTAKQLSEITTKDTNDKEVKVHFATIGIDQNLHGTRRGGDKTHPNFLFFNFKNPQAALNNVIQGAADQFSLVQLVMSFKLPSNLSPNQKEMFFDKERIVYIGHSQGSVVGPLFLAFEPAVKVAVLSGAGGSLIQSLLNKTKPIDVAAGIRGLFGEEQPMAADHPMLNLLQLYFERNDALNYGKLIAKSPRKGIPPKHIFQPFGVGDTFTPPVTMERLARVMGVEQVGASETNIAGISSNPLKAPVQGNLSVQGKKITATLGQYKPDGYDGHFVLFRHKAAVRHFRQFLGTFLTNKDNVPIHVK